VQIDSLGRDVERVLDIEAAGCADCHRTPEPSLPHTVRLSNSQDVLRTVVPIPNGPECAGCHSAEDATIGLLLVDISIAGVEQHILNDLRVDLLFSLGAAVLVSLGIYVLMHRLVVRRVAALRGPLAAFAQGDFRARLPASLRPNDEIDALVGEFNHMAGRLERHVREQQALGELRQRAIVEERERIARELHDGLAQLLGYVNTKAMAVRLMLKNQQHEAAEKHLLQLEEAAQALFVDVREAILGLKMAGLDEMNIVEALKAYVTQFSRLSGFPVGVHAAPEVACLALPAEAQAQLLRIVQEALTNVRKHASASRAEVNLNLCDNIFELTVCDDGAGFNPNGSPANGWSHLGLRTMRERSEAIGAQFAIDPNPGRGARVSVRLPLDENGHEYDARVGR
jgi:signal transduction histidine kinase